MPSARRVHFFTNTAAHSPFKVGGVHTISPCGYETSTSRYSRIVRFAIAAARTLIAYLIYRKDPVILISAGFRIHTIRNPDIEVPFSAIANV
jgi:hypothetical protein